MNHMKGNKKKTQQKTAGIICVEMKLYLKEKSLKICSKESNTPLTKCY